jgi:hypothetical protein
LKGYVAAGLCALLLIRCSGLFWLKCLHQPACRGGA